LSPLEREKVAAQEAIGPMQLQVEQKSAEVQRLQGNLTRLQREEGVPFSESRQNMAKLVKAVSNETR
jgi:hypothetical protein